MQPRMKSTWYWFCWMVTLVLDWLPGYCRYFTVQATETPTLRQLTWKRHWRWQWHALWGTRLLGHAGLLNDFIEECDHRRRG